MRSGCLLLPWCSGLSVEDLFFWAATGIVVFLALQKENHGELRGYIIAGACAGMLLYKNAVSGFYVKYLSGMILHIVVYIKRIAYFVLKPIRRAKKCVKSGILASKEGIKKVVREKIKLFGSENKA